MPVDELFTHPVRHVVQGEAPRVLLNGGVEVDLEQHIPQLLPESVHISLIDGLGHLVRLLQKVAADGGMGLLLVPGTAAGMAQNAHNLRQITAVIGLFHRPIYHSIT
jgi:hypothetical protein